MDYMYKFETLEPHVHEIHATIVLKSNIYIPYTHQVLYLLT
jgi:hypothetical protein